MFPFKNKPFMGLDMDDNEVRLLQLRQFKKQAVIEKFGIYPLPAGVVTEEKITQPQSLSTFIAQQVHKMAAKTSPTAIALSSQFIISRKIKLPRYLTAVECEAEISNRLTDYLSGMDEALSFDFAELDSGDEEYRDIFLIAARTEQMYSYVNVIKAAGLDVTAVDTDVLALIRAVRKSGFDQEPLLAILVVRHTAAQFVVVRDKEILLNQSMVLSDLVVQLKNAIHVCQLALRHIVSIGVDGTTGSCIKKECQLEVVPLDPLSNITLASHINPQEIREAMPRLLVCLGLAWRGVAS